MISPSLLHINQLLPVPSIGLFLSISNIRLIDSVLFHVPHADHALRITAIISRIFQIIAVSSFLPRCLLVYIGMHQYTLIVSFKLENYSSVSPSVFILACLIHQIKCGVSSFIVSTTVSVLDFDFCVFCFIVQNPFHQFPTCHFRFSPRRFRLSCLRHNESRICVL